MKNNSEASWGHRKENRHRTGEQGFFLGFYVQSKDDPAHKAIINDIVYDAFALHLTLHGYSLVLYHICEVHGHQWGGIINL